MEVELTLAGSHLSKFLTTVMILSETSAGLRKVCWFVCADDGILYKEWDQVSESEDVIIIGMHKIC